MASITKTREKTSSVSKDLGKNVNKSPVAPNTGGGTPLDKGQKLAENPVPRDPAQARTSEGKFDTKASQGLTRKYPYHGENVIKTKDPKTGKETTHYVQKKENERQAGSNLENEGKKQHGETSFHQADSADSKEKTVKAGSVFITSDGRRFIVIKDLTAKEFHDYMTMAYQDVKTGKTTFFAENVFMEKKGRMSSAEKVAIKNKQYDTFIGMQNLGNTSEARAAAIKSAADELQMKQDAFNTIYSQTATDEEKAQAWETIGGKAAYGPESVLGGKNGAPAGQPQKKASKPSDKYYDESTGKFNIPSDAKVADVASKFTSQQKAAILDKFNKQHPEFKSKMSGGRNNDADFIRVVLYYRGGK